jgi:hypothetical protein
MSSAALDATISPAGNAAGRMARPFGDKDNHEGASILE